MVKKKQKYEALSVQDVEENYDDDEKKHIVNSYCVWTSIRTVMLLFVYFIPSISLTFYQRWLIQKFHFPLAVVVCHLVIKFVGSSVIRNLLVCKQGTRRINVDWATYCKSVGPIGLVSGIDVGLSNWGLEFVTISLYTLTKSTTIIFIFMCGILFKLEKKSWSLAFIVIMISSGLALFTYKATQFNTFGFILLLLASLSSGVRWTCAQILLQDNRKGLSNPIDLVYHVQPWMLVSVLPFAIAFEGNILITSCLGFRWEHWPGILYIWGLVACGALLALVMEVSEFLIVTYTSSLTLSIGGIFKEIFILVLAVKWNGDQMSLVNVVGLFVCLVGIVGHVIHKIRNSQRVVSNSKIYGESGGFELNEPLMPGKYLVSSTDEDDSDVEELFNVLKSRDR